LLPKSKIIEERLDKILLQRRLISTRVRAEKVIEEFGVLVNGKLIHKPGKKFPEDVKIELIKEEIPWVSRAALKLLKAKETWGIDFKDKTILDIGASTGGFTEVALNFESKKVYCVDVGINQLHEKIKCNPKIVNLEKTHVRELNSNLINEKIDICMVDVSFISLEKILAFIHPFLKNDADVILLIKPQFEVGKENISKRGIVKNKTFFPVVIEKIMLEAKKCNLVYQNHIESPILGAKGNIEFLMYLKKFSS
jgi:23S rRNA (cytidine1920-2'-O)/16S rRNA (cytidine1409-2'-O)-methyltransferase